MWIARFDPVIQEGVGMSRTDLADRHPIEVRIGNSAYPGGQADETEEACNRIKAAGTGYRYN